MKFDNEYTVYYLIYVICIVVQMMYVHTYVHQRTFVGIDQRK